MAPSKRKNRSKTFAVALRRVREAQGLSRDRLAELSGLHVDTVLRCETGRISPTLATAERLASALEVELAELVSGFAVDERTMVERALVQALRAFVVASTGR